MNKFTKGILILFGSILAWSSLEVTGSYIFAEGAGPVTLLSTRFLIATLLFGATILFQKYRTGENLFLVEKQDIKRFLTNGAFLAVHLITYWFGWEYLDPNIPVIYGIFYFYPFVLALVAVYLYGEKFSTNRKIAVGLGTIGSLFAIEFLPTFSTEALTTSGVLLCVVAVAAWVGYLLVGQTIMKKYKPLTIVFYDFLQVFVYISLLQSPATTISQLTTHNLLAILYIAIVASYIAYLCYWTAIKYIGASNAGVGELCFGSFFAVIIAYFFLDTSPSIYQLLGLGLLSGGIFLIHKEKEVVYDQ